MKDKLSSFKSTDVILTSIYTAQFKCCLALSSSRDGREMKKPRLTGHQALCGCPAYVPLTTMTRSGHYHPCPLHTAGRAKPEHKLICLQSPQCSSYPVATPPLIFRMSPLAFQIGSWVTSSHTHEMTKKSTWEKSRAMWPGEANSAPSK